MSHGGELETVYRNLDTVVVSHPHGDHIGGATAGTGEAARVTYP